MNRRRRRTYRRSRQSTIPWRDVGRHLFWAGCLTLLVAALGSGGWVGYRSLMVSGLLDVKDIDVYGANRVGPELGAYLQLPERASMLEVDTERLTQRLEKHPWIKNAHVRKRYPNGLALTLEERTPALLHLTRNLYVADTDGVWIKQLDGDEVFDLPVVTGLSPRPVTTAVDTLRSLAAFVQYWEEPAGPVRIGEIHYVGIDAVWVYPMGEGPRFHLPLDPARWDQARARLIRVMNEARSLGLELKVVDLLYPDRVIAQRKI